MLGFFLGVEQTFGDGGRGGKRIVIFGLRVPGVSVNSIPAGLLSSDPPSQALVVIVLFARTPGNYYFLVVLSSA